MLIFMYGYVYWDFNFEINSKINQSNGGLFTSIVRVNCYPKSFMIFVFNMIRDDN